MLRALTAIVVSSLVLVACGSSSEEPAGDSSASTSSASPSSGAAGSSEAAGGPYFTDAESDAINVVARKAQTAAARATAAANERHCNRVGDTRGYAAWRACWHRLLDPYARGLLAISEELRVLQVGSFPSGCISALRQIQGTFAGFARRVKGLLAGIDSDVRSRQTRALNSYDDTVNAIESGYQKPFQALTQACYSPEQLKKLQSGSSATPAP